MKTYLSFVLLCLSFISVAQEVTKLKPYRVDFQSGYYKGQKLDASGYDSQFNYTMARDKHLINLKFNTGIGTRLGPNETSQDFEEFLVEEIFFPVRYGLIGVQYGYKIDIANRLAVEPYAGLGFLYANKGGYFVVPISTKIMYRVGRKLELGAGVHYNINALNNFFSTNFIIGYQL